MLSFWNRCCGAWNLTRSQAFSFHILWNSANWGRYIWCSHISEIQIRQLTLEQSCVQLGLLMLSITQFYMTVTFFFCFSYEEPATGISVSPVIKLTEQWFWCSLCKLVNMSLHQSVCCLSMFCPITCNKWANYSTHALAWYQSLQNNWVRSVNKFLLSLNHCLAYGGMTALRWGVSIISFYVMCSEGFNCNM